MTTGLQLNFDARTVPPASVDGGGDQLPVSDGLGHRVVARSASSVATKANDGSTMLVLKLEVIEGPLTGAKGDYRLNIGNKSDKAREIAYGQLSALCHAIGAFAVGNTDELLNKPFRAVVVAQSDPKYTEIKGVLTDQGIDPGNPNAGPRSREAGVVTAPVAAAAPAPQTFAAPQPAATAFAPAPAPAPTAFAAPAAAPAPAPAVAAWTPPAVGAGAPPAAAPWGKPPGQ